MTETSLHTPPPGGRTSLWLGIVLVVSLALNLFLAGAIVASWLHFRGPWDGSAHFPGAGFLLGMQRPEVFAQVIEPERREVLKEVFHAHRDEIRSRIQALRQARRNMGREMRAEPFDPDRFRSTQEQMREAQNAATAAIHEALADVLSRMTPEERARLRTHHRDRFHLGL